MRPAVLRILFVGIALLTAAPGWVPVSIVQQNTGLAVASTSSLVITLPSLPTAGNTIVVAHRSGQDFDKDQRHQQEDRRHSGLRERAGAGVPSWFSRAAPNELRLVSASDALDVNGAER